MKKTSHVAANFSESIFSTMSKMARDYNAYNLSQGLPDFDGPDFVRQYASDAIMGDKNQQASAHGILKLRQSVSNNFKKYYNLDYCAESEVTITSGATEAVFSSVLALVNPGDEVILIEPFFDTYIPAIKLAGGVPVVVTLHAPDFKLNIDELESAFSEKTKLLILNTPHNPSGQIMEEETLRQVSELVIKYDSYLISDEVYEHLLYDGCKHIPPATLPGMHERTITVSSSGKTMSLTGWRIGWAAAPLHLSTAVRMVHQNVTFSAPRPLQEAMARALSEMDEYLVNFRETFQAKRDLLYSGLKEAGYNPLLPQSTYFIMVPVPEESGLCDVEYAKHLIKEKKVATIPPSAFYMNSDDGKKYLRFCFAKKDETLVSAINMLKGVKE